MDLVSRTIINEWKRAGGIYRKAAEAVEKEMNQMKVCPRCGKYTNREDDEDLCDKCRRYLDSTEDEESAHPEDGWRPTEPVY